MAQKAENFLVMGTGEALDVHDVLSFPHTHDPAGGIPLTSTDESVAYSLTQYNASVKSARVIRDSSSGTVGFSPHHAQSYAVIVMHTRVLSQPVGHSLQQCDASIRDLSFGIGSSCAFCFHQYVL